MSIYERETIHLMRSLFYFGIIMKDYAEQFYKGKAWQDCRNAYAKSKQGLCELCLKDGVIEAGVIVHHKVHIDPETIRQPDVALSFDNLQLLCRKHHAEMHGSGKRYKVDEMGRISPH